MGRPIVAGSHKKNHETDNCIVRREQGLTATQTIVHQAPTHLFTKTTTTTTTATHNLPSPIKMPLEGSATLPPPPPISQRTLQISGLLVDVYGLSELSPATTHVSCLWLHHPRGRRKEDMADIAARCVGAWNGDDDGRKRARTRGLLALAYDQRNHGTRTVDEAANGSWREGNPMHALDMFGVVQGMVADQRVML